MRHASQFILAMLIVGLGTQLTASVQYGLTQLTQHLDLPTLTAFLVGGSGLTLAAGSAFAKVASDPQLLKKWGDVAFKLGEQKTEFNESEIGTQFMKDGPRPSDRTTAPPILYSQGLAGGGRFIDMKIHNPLISGIENILNAGRLEGQKREGSEETLKRDNIKAMVDEWFLAVKESDVRIGEQVTANEDVAGLMRAFTEGIGDTLAQVKDKEVFFSLAAGYGSLHYRSAAKRAGTANAAIPIASVGEGLERVPEEHNRLYTWVNGALTKVPYSATQATYSAAITTELDKFQTDDLPTLDLLRKINRICRTTNMIPCNIRKNDGKMHSYFLVYMPGSVKDLLEDDADYKAVMNAAYQGMVKDHPLLRDDDVMYKNLIIRDSDVLDDDYFSAGHSFSATGSSETDNMSIDVATANNITTYGISPGDRGFTAASTAATSFGATGFDAVKRIKRIFVLGANAVIRASGKENKLAPLVNTDYEKDKGLGMSAIFGHRRQETMNPAASAGTLVDIPQSFEILAFGG